MSCINYFLNLLSRKDYSAYQLRRKGQEKGFSESEITEAINDLQSQGYQSDTRLVESMISSSQGKYGKSVIKRKCREKGISADIFEQIWLEQIEEDDSELIEPLAELKAKVIRKYKIEDFKNIDPKTKNKLFNYLQYRGFNPFEVLANWQDKK
ncbi:MAG: recombination regulator RecX [Aphanothece sp. CMT-3BRIN-NPC111]|jgi:regulatory protein|nr:recombination regulator RecX [Aphanothece sp. CMT-3BRIN-NPC111]